MMGRVIGSGREKLARFCAADCSSREVYDLFAVSNHTGSLLSGHYTAFTRHPYSHKWHGFNDARSVSQSPLASNGNYSHTWISGVPKGYIRDLYPKVAEIQLMQSMLLSLRSC